MRYSFYLLDQHSLPSYGIIWCPNENKPIRSPLDTLTGSMKFSVPRPMASSVTSSYKNIRIQGTKGQQFTSSFYQSCTN